MEGGAARRQGRGAAPEAIDIDADAAAAQARLREIQGQWHDAGRLPREVAAGLDRRMRTVEEKVRTAMESAWRRTPPESSPLLAQVREQVAEAEQRLSRAQASGDARRIREAEEALEAKRRFLNLAQHTS
jgi:hypothetical protein